MLQFERSGASFWNRLPPRCCAIRRLYTRSRCATTTAGIECEDNGRLKRGAALANYRQRIYGGHEIWPFS
ncbi:hypothetical protein KCP70_17905 [Salmonella enterica subsp. enterica]|nr:hypothetical protein KCP70_17905 [Salmonella enterica subsp. enterica]